MAQMAQMAKNEAVAAVARLSHQPDFISGELL